MSGEFKTVLGMEAVDTVTNDFVDAIDEHVVQSVGRTSGSRVSRYDWPSAEEDEDVTEWPFVVVRDGREFEVDIDVRVVELTPEVKAKREKFMTEALAEIERRNTAREARR